MMFIHDSDCYPNTIILKIKPPRKKIECGLYKLNILFPQRKKNENELKIQHFIFGWGIELLVAIPPEN